MNSSPNAITPSQAPSDGSAMANEVPVIYRQMRGISFAILPPTETSGERYTIDGELVHRDHFMAAIALASAQAPL